MDLSVRNWLRGGTPGFVGGSGRASGFVVGHYNDSALFIGGDLTAAGYVRRAKPDPDFPPIAPHQTAGRIDARQFDVLAASDDDLRAAFVDDVLTRDAEATYLDEKAILERSRAVCASGVSERALHARAALRRHRAEARDRSVDHQLVPERVRPSATGSRWSSPSSGDSHFGKSRSSSKASCAEDS